MNLHDNWDTPGRERCYAHVADAKFLPALPALKLLDINLPFLHGLLSNDKAALRQPFWEIISGMIALSACWGPDILRIKIENWQ